jgi:hypothetical protein
LLVIDAHDLDNDLLGLGLRAEETQKESQGHKGGKDIKREPDHEQLLQTPKIWEKKTKGQ